MVGGRAVRQDTGEGALRVQSANAVFEGNKLVFSDGITAAAPGQSAVLRRNDEVMGGVIIASAGTPGALSS